MQPYEERQQQLQQKLAQRRRNLQVQLLEQQSVVAEANLLQGSSAGVGENELQIGQAPLDTDRIAVIGISVGAVQDKTVWVGGFSVSWLDNVSAPIVSSYVCLFGGNFYPELLAVKSALDGCPPNESLTILTQSVQLASFINNAKHKGKRKALTEQLENTVRELIDARSARVQAVESKDEWIKGVQKYASKLAISARKLREEEDPTLPPEQQAALEAMKQRQQAADPPVPKQPATTSQQPSPQRITPQLPTYNMEVPRRTVAVAASRPSSQPKPIPAHFSSQPPLRPSRPAFETAMYNGPFVPQSPFRPAFIPPPFPMMQPPLPMTHQPPFQPMFPFASQHRVSPPPSQRAISRAGSSQPSVPISWSDVPSAITSVRDSAAELSGYPQTQAASGVGSNSPASDTPWIVPESEAAPSLSVMTVDAPAKTTIDEITERFKESKLKRKRSVDEEGESGEIAKKIKSSTESDDEDEEFHDAEEGEGQRSWSSWFGGVVKKFF